MFFDMYKRALNVLRKRPVRLWGLSLLTGVIEVIAILFSFGFLPIGIAFCYVVGCGMQKIYLDSLEGKSINTDQLFEGFKSGKSFFRTAGGMAWQKLWTLIWSLVSGGALLCLIPVLISSLTATLRHSFGRYSYYSSSPFASVRSGSLVVLCVLIFILGLIPTIVKAYEYRFVPYILMTRSDVNATAALRLSKKLTKGKKLQMFLADIVLVGGYFVIILFLSLFSNLPLIGGLFAIVELVFQIVYMLFKPIFTGLYGAAFYLAPTPVKPVEGPYTTYTSNSNYTQNTYSTENAGENVAPNSENRYYQ